MLILFNLQYIELPDAYIRWIIAKSRGIAATDFHICNFPFVFDAGAKTVLLQTDQAFQMHNAAQQAVGEAVFRNLIQQVTLAINVCLPIS